MAIVVVEIVHDGLLQFVDALEDAAADAFSGDPGKEALDHDEPRAGRRREVQMEARMPLEPALYRGGLVGGIIIDDQMQVSTGSGISSLWGVQFSPLGGLAISRFLDRRLRFSAVDHD